MISPDRFIASCNSWGDFWGSAKLLSASEKGLAFERLTQLYLQTAPEYRTKLQNVWLLRDVPPNIRRQLNLPAPDESIDLIARTRTGEYWGIRSKFRSQCDKPLTRRKLGTFTSLVFNTCNNISLAVVSHTATKPVSKRHLMRNTVEIGLGSWQSLDAEAWILIVGRLKGESARPKPRNPMPHQRAALLRAPSKGSKIVFTTYQSSDKLAAAARRALADRLLNGVARAHDSAFRSLPFPSGVFSYRTAVR